MPKKLTLVVAGAGYGKTTLVAQAMARPDVDAVWYCIDAYARDWISFIRCLVAGMETVYPQFGSKIRPLLSTVPRSQRRREAILDAL